MDGMRDEAASTEAVGVISVIFEDERRHLHWKFQAPAL
jgi:hypothetical protein